MKLLIIGTISLAGFTIFLITTTYVQPTTKNENNGVTLTHSDNLKIERMQQKIDTLEREISDLRDFTAQSNGRTASFPKVKFKNVLDRKRILVTGGAGFVGSHLVDHLMKDGNEVIALDNFFTGRRRNLEQWTGHPNFELVHHDIVNPYYSEVDQIYHLASPASPPHYMYNAVKTLKTNTLGTINVLGLARRVKARVLLASSSEIYGDPEVSPQHETYFGRVNTVGPRSCYDEGKRAAEALMMAFHRQENVDIRIARIFNTFGPRMHINDGRVVSNFIIQALKGSSFTVYGSGNQTRSFQYVSDLVAGLVALMNSNTTLPVNIGNPEEYTIIELAKIVLRLVENSKSSVTHLPKKEDDPQQRKPDIHRASELLGWSPKIKMLDGLVTTIQYFKKELFNERINENV